MSEEQNQIEPLHDFLLCVISGHKERKTPGGIIKPEGAGGLDTRLRVVAVGPGKMTLSGTRAPIGVNVGDLVLPKPGAPVYGTDDTASNGLCLVSADALLAIDRRPFEAPLVVVPELVRVGPAS
jgi:co-chaperonin GroES (HSP10)